MHLTIEIRVISVLQFLRLWTPYTNTCMIIAALHICDGFTASNFAGRFLCLCKYYTRHNPKIAHSLLFAYYGRYWTFHYRAEGWFLLSRSHMANSDYYIIDNLDRLPTSWPSLNPRLPSVAPQHGIWQVACTWRNRVRCSCPDQWEMWRREYTFTGSTALIKFSTGARTLYTLASAMANL